MWGDAAQGIAQGQVNAFNDLNRREPGVWSLAQGENSLLVRSGQVVESGSTQLELHRAIPVPDKDVALAEVLEFQSRRRDELQKLREEIDSLVAAIDRVPDKAAALAEQVALVDKACADAIRVGSEWQFPMRLVSFKSTYEIRPIQTLAGAIAGYAGGAIAMPASASALSALVGAAAATAPALKLSFDGFAWRGLRPRQGPYRYVYQFHREVF